MKIFILTILLVCLSHVSIAAEINEPKPQELNSVSFSSIDDLIPTLGEAEIIVDFSAARDDVFELSARRANLLLEDSRPINSFGYSQEAGVLVGASSPVSYISVAGKDNDTVLALFYNAFNEIIAPEKHDIGLFDLAFNPIDFSYEPSIPPKNVIMDVSVLIDVSGSMRDAIDGVTHATRRFMEELPDFTRCSVLTFGSTVTRLTDSDPAKLVSCPSSVDVLKNGLIAQGSTALHRAIEESLLANGRSLSGLPKLTIVLTDGHDTQNPGITAQYLKFLKGHTDSKILIFWAGQYDPSYLAGLADMEIVSENDIFHDLNMFFKSIGISINGLQSLTIN